MPQFEVRSKELDLTTAFSAYIAARLGTIKDNPADPTLTSQAMKDVVAECFKLVDEVMPEVVVLLTTTFWQDAAGSLPAGSPQQKIFTDAIGAAVGALTPLATGNPAIAAVLAGLKGAIGGGTPAPVTPTPIQPVTPPGP